MSEQAVPAGTAIENQTERRVPRITVSVGPGPYVADLVGALSSAGMLARVIYSWPDLRVLVREGDTSHLKLKYQADWFRHLVRFIWGTWRRIPVIGKSERPRLWVDAVYDHVASGHLGDPDIFLGWSQVSLYSMEVARNAGATVVLEHPMLHVDEWLRTIPQECELWGVDPLSCYSVVPDAMAHRMRTECSRADRIVVPSGAAVDSFLRAGVAREKMVCVPFGVDTTIFHPIDEGDQQPDRPFRVLYAGRMELLKGLPYLLQAWKSLQLKDAELVLVGRRLPETEMILEQHKTNNVRVLNDVPRNQLAALYNAADVLVFPSLCDGFGLVMLEAMACGVPVIATMNSGGPDCVTDGVNGFLVPIKNSEAIVEKLKLMHSDRKRTSFMRVAARQRVEKEFTIKHYQDRLVHCYQGIMAGRSHVKP